MQMAEERAAQEREAARIAQEQEEARIAQQQAEAAEAQRQQQALLAQQQEQARLLQEQERARLEEETRQKVLAEQAARAKAEEAKRQAEQEAARIALEAERARIEAQQEATRQAQEAAAKERAAMAEERAALEEAKRQAAAATPKTPDYTATTSTATELTGMRTSQLQDRLNALSARDPRLGVEMVLSKSPRSTKEQAMKALQESAGDVDKAVDLLSAGAGGGGGSAEVTESNELRSFVLMVTPSDLVSANRMLRVQASSLAMMKSVLAEKLNVTLPDGAADVSMVEPGRKDPTFIKSLDQLPNKAKVQLWSAGTDPDSAPAAGGGGGPTFKLTVTASPDFAADGTVVEVQGADLNGLQEAIGAKLGKPGVQLLLFDPDFGEFCKPDSLDDVKPECEVKLASS